MWSNNHSCTFRCLGKQNYKFIARWSQKKQGTTSLGVELGRRGWDTRDGLCSHRLDVLLQLLACSVVEVQLELSCCLLTCKLPSVTPQPVGPSPSLASKLFCLAREEILFFSGE